MLLVIGHKAPDTDSVCSAMAYAALQRALGRQAEARMAGRPNGETAYVLRQLGLSAPEVLEDAAGCRLALVDHAFYTQAVNGAREAQIETVIDHHGEGDVTAAEVLNELTGAAATLVYRLYRRAGVEPTAQVAGAMAAAILSDTRHLSAKATTPEDRQALAALCPLAGIRDPGAFFTGMAAAANAYEGMTDRDIFLSEYKEYTLGAHRVGITAVNGHGTVHESRCHAMRRCGAALYPQLGVEHLYVMVHDLEGRQTDIFSLGPGAAETAARVFSRADGVHILCRPNISRKTDLVPRLRAIYEAE